VDDFSSQSGDSNPAEHFKFAPLPISGNSTDSQDAVPEYIHHYQESKFKDINVDYSLHDAQEELMHHIKNTAILQGCLMMFTNGKKNAQIGLQVWICKIKNSDEPNDGQVRAIHAPPHQIQSTEALVITYLPHQSATGISHLRFGVRLQTPKLQPMQPGTLQKNLPPSLLSASMVNSTGMSGGKTHIHKQRD
jgi:hypothetical protein